MSAGPDTRLFWRALVAFAGCVTLAWTVGAVLQFRHAVLGLALTEFCCFAVPAAVVLFLEHRRVARGSSGVSLVTGSAELCGGAKVPASLPTPPAFAVPGVARPAKLERFLHAPFRVPDPKDALLSALLGSVVVLVAVANGVAVRRALDVPLPSPPGLGWVVCVVAFLSPLCEELLFRPVLQRGLASVWRPGTALLATALLFGLTHGSIVRLPETFVLGLFSGVVFLKTRNYWACVLFHGMANTLAPVLWGWVPRSPPLFHPVTALFLTGVAVFLAWRFELPRTERLWGFWRHVLWALFGTGTEAKRTGAAPVVAALVYWAGVLVMIGVIWGLAVAESVALRLAQATMQVRQEDVWRLDASHTITVLSRVYYARWPGRRESLSYALPYTEARVLRAEIGGQSAGVRTIGAGMFELRWPDRLPEAPRVVQVVWAVPLDALEDATRGYRARLQALVPVTGYALALRLEPGSGYEFERAPERTETELFSILDTGPLPRKSFGTCGIGLRRKPMMNGGR